MVSPLNPILYISHTIGVSAIKFEYISEYVNGGGSNVCTNLGGIFNHL